MTPKEEERIKQIMKEFPEGTAIWEVFTQSWAPLFMPRPDQMLLLKKLDEDGVRLVE